MYSSMASSSSGRTIQIFFPGMHAESDTSASGVKCETRELASRITDRKGAQPRSAAKRKREGRQSLEGRSGSQQRDPQNSAKKPKPNHSDRDVQFHPLQDYLRPGLDVMFCGINPGRMSAETGHHFANPTNHFWRCLHRSGMTTTLVPPSEDFSLPERFNIGLTNLVDRPSTHAHELSRTEMITSVPALLDKLARFRPRFVCFVGVVIWEVVRNSLMKLLQKGTLKRTEKGTKRDKSQMGLQTYKLVYGDTRTELPQETFLYVVPCTSGRVVRYQLSDKITLFTELRMLVKMPSEMDTSGIESVIWHSSPSDVVVPHLLLEP